MIILRTQKQVDLETIAAKVENDLGVKLMAHNSTDTVHGHMNMIQHPDGYEIQVVLYEQDEAPIFQKDIHGKIAVDHRGLQIPENHATTFVKHPIAPDRVIEKIKEII